MATYAFMNTIRPNKVETWKSDINEMKTTRKADLQASRKRVGLTREEVWLQQTPAGPVAVVYLEAPDIGKVFEAFLTSQEPFDKWFRDKVQIDVHGMNPSAPPPPLNERILG